MASSGNQDTTGDESTADEATVEAAAAHVEQVVHASEGPESVTPTGESPSSTDEAVVGDLGDADQPTEVRRTIPPLLTDTQPAEASETGDATATVTPAVEDDSAPTALGAPLSKERIADAASVARDRVAESTAGVREKAAEGASHARERAAEGAAQAREKTSEAAAQAKVKTTKARKRFAAAASEAKGRASSAAADARERAAQADVSEFAHSTTSLIDTARPFFLAGCAALFAVLGFLEGDAGTAQVFAVGSVIFVIGAAFSGEINAFLASRSHARERAGDERPERATDERADTDA